MANSALTRWQPARPATTMRDLVNRLFDDSFFGPTWAYQGFGSGFSMDIYEEGNQYVVDAALPGVNPDNVEISLQGNTLTIKGRVPNIEQKEGRNYLLQEISGGEFTRTVTLPAEIDSNNVEATFQNGLLHLVLPKAPAYQSRRIQVKPGK